VAGIYDKQTNTFRTRTKKVVRQIFKLETSEMLKDALFEVMEQNPEV